MSMESDLSCLARFLCHYAVLVIQPQTQKTLVSDWPSDFFSSLWKNLFKCLLNDWTETLNDLPLWTTIPMSLGYCCYGDESSRRSESELKRIAMVTSKTDPESDSEWTQAADTWWILSLRCLYTAFTQSFHSPKRFMLSLVFFDSLIWF